VVDKTREPRRAQLEVETHHARPHAVGTRVSVVGLRSGDVGCRLELGREPLEPARIECDVLIHLGDQVVAGAEDAEVDRGGGSAAFAVQERERSALHVPVDDPQRGVRAAVVHHDHLEGPCVALGEHGRQRRAERPLPVVERDHEAHTGTQRITRVTHRSKMPQAG
jgi:hypothetical protein